MDKDKRFRKYQLIEANVAKAASDTRPESYKIDIDSIKILSEPIPTNNKWELRKAKIMPLMSRSLCYLQSERDRNKEPTLGFFKPRMISALKLEQTSSNWTEADLARLTQSVFFGNIPKTRLEKLPYDFTYKFTCDDNACRGHELKCTDWEMGASYWAWRQKYGSNWEAKFKDMYETKMSMVLDTHFFVGTLSTHPSEWIIIGLFYPPK
ncbi:MAG: hypothetical protein AABZ77_00320 [Chloroflexota bacterium]